MTGRSKRGLFRAFQVEGVDIVMANVGGELRAFASRCPHQGGSLNRAHLEEKVLICPWHQWQFERFNPAARAGPKAMNGSPHTP